MEANDYFGNIFRTREYIIQRGLRRVMEGVDKTRWLEEFAPTDVNAFYHPSLNQFGKD